jgi:hypothetical protein
LVSFPQATLLPRGFSGVQNLLLEHGTGEVTFFLDAADTIAMHKTLLLFESIKRVYIETTEGGRNPNFWRLNAITSCHPKEWACAPITNMAIAEFEDMYRLIGRLYARMIQTYKDYFTEQSLTGTVPTFQYVNLATTSIKDGREI